MVQNPIDITLGDWGAMVKELQRTADAAEAAAKAVHDHAVQDKQLQDVLIKEIAEIKDYIKAQSTLTRFLRWVGGTTIAGVGVAAALYGIFKGLSHAR